MFEFFKKKPSNNINKSVSLPKTKTEMSDFFELNSHSVVRDEVNDALKKQFDYTQFEMTRDDQSNYFGLEFDIQTTASRLKSLYVREPWVYASADRIARNCASVPLIIVDTKTEEPLPNHPANAIVNQGSSYQDDISKRWVQYLDLVLAGNAHLIMDEKYTYGVTVPIELVRLEAKSANSFDEIIKYGPIDCANIYGYGLSSVSMTVPFQQLIHFKLPNPFNPFYGLSPFAAGSRPILLDRYKNEFEMAFYHRGASHSGVIENEHELTKEKMRRLIASFEQLYTGKRNWWRPMFLPKGARWKSSSLTMAEMQHLEGLRENRMTLLAVLGIPPSLVGIVQDVNRSTAAEQSKIFWQNTIIPLVNFYCAGFNNSYLFKYVYSGSVKAMAQLSGIQAIEGSLASKGEVVQLLKEVYTVNELRTKVLGDDPMPEDDPRGNLFAKEISPNNLMGVFGTNPNQAYSNPTTQETEEDNNDNGDQDLDEMQEDEAALQGSELSIKGFAESTIVQVEKVYGELMLGYLREYEKQIWGQAAYALDESRNLKSYLMVKKDERRDLFVERAMPILQEAMQRGYSMSMLSTKKLTTTKADPSMGYEFSPEDEMAIDAIKARTEDGQRRLLEQRSIASFYGWDDTYSDHISKYVEDGLHNGKTYSQMANDIRSDMQRQSPGKGEVYRDQAFTISRTESLTAVSEGIAWSSNVLNQVFTEVNKVWVHVGDIDTNEHARKEHYEFGQLGQQSLDYVYKNRKTGNSMLYPRETATGPEDRINCRCSMYNVIPPTAHSRAKHLLF